MRGGKRENSGRKKLEDKPTINFRIEASKKALLKSLYPDLSKEFRDWVDALIENKI